MFLNFQFFYNSWIQPIHSQIYQSVMTDLLTILSLFPFFCSLFFGNYILYYFFQYIYRNIKFLIICVIPSKQYFGWYFSSFWNSTLGFYFGGGFSSLVLKIFFSLPQAAIMVDESAITLEVVFMSLNSLFFLVAYFFF